jgi:hypothetical protein
MGRGRPRKNPKYEKEDRSFIIHQNDVDLTPIEISLPKAPKPELIAGYGKKPVDQFFVREEQPPRLRAMEREAMEILQKRSKVNKNYVITGYRLLEKFWDLFEKERDSMPEEVAFIKRTHWHRLHGYWFFNKGKPTYITGDYYDYLNYLTQPDVAHMEYRDSDRKRYLFRHYGETATETFAVVDTETNEAKKVGFVYKMKELFARICFGTSEPKFRRGGMTMQGVHKVIKSVSEGFGRYGTIVSMEGNNAEKHWNKKLIPGWRGYPLWLRPMWNGPASPKTIKYDHPQGDLSGWTTLGGVMDYTDSAGEKKNDGDKLHVALFDEEGKTEGGDIFERWSVNKLAMSLGGGSEIIGWSMHPSTVEEMDDGGIEYMKLCSQSKFYERQPNGQTLSGLFELFIPAQDGLEGFVDRWGYSVTDTPTEEQIKYRPDAHFARLKIGAREYLQDKLDVLLKKGDPASLEQYRSEKRKMPMCYADCWLGTSGDIGFNVDIIDTRMAELRRRKLVVPGYFRWKGGVQDTEVEWVNDPAGRFEMSRILKPNESNKKLKQEAYDYVRDAHVSEWTPIGGYAYTLGMDPFRYTNKQEAKNSSSGSRQSDGGIAVLWERDDKIDKSDNQMDWETLGS